VDHILAFSLTMRNTACQRLLEVWSAAATADT
jgi:hypothetical protein